MIDKVVSSPADAVADIPDGATVMLGGFGTAGTPRALVDALADRGVRDLVLIHNGGGRGASDRGDPGQWFGNGMVRHLIASYPVARNRNAFADAFESGQCSLELIPQGTLAERIRAGGAGIAAFYTPTAVGTMLAEGKEIREINGRQHVLETALTADFALIKASRGDRFGNLVYLRNSRNFNPIMATAARVTIVEVDEIVDPAEIAPEDIVTPGIFVDRMILGGRRP